MTIHDALNLMLRILCLIVVLMCDKDFIASTVPSLFCYLSLLPNFFSRISTSSIVVKSEYSFSIEFLQKNLFTCRAVT